MTSIRNVYVSRKNILIVDTSNKLWIMGNNHQRMTGINTKSNPIYSPIDIGVSLDDDETIKRFYSSDYIIIVFTSKGNLFMGDHLHGVPEIKNNGPTVIRSARDMTSARSSPQLIRSNSNNDDQSNYDSEEEIEISRTDDDSETENNNANEQRATERRVFDTDSDEELIDSTNNSSIINNNIFFHKMYKEFTKTEEINKKSTGFSLFSDNVENIVVLCNCIFFMKNKKLYVYHPDLEVMDMIINKKFSISSIFVENGKYKYYQLVLPFDISNAVFNRHFIYVFSNGYHHILSACDIYRDVYYYHEDENTDICWIYFTTDFQLDPNDIYYDCTQSTIYVKQNNMSYTYCHSSHRLEQITDASSSPYIVSSNIGDTNMLFFVNKNGLYDVDSDKIMKYNPLLDYFVDIDNNEETNLILIKKDDPKQYEIVGDDLFFNVNNLLYYKLLDCGLIYYDSSNTLYLCSFNRYSESEYNISEINQIHINDETCYRIYICNNLPSKITNISFTGHIILVEADGKFYYRTFANIGDGPANDFAVDKFTEISINVNNKKISMVSKNLIVYRRRAENDDNDDDNNDSISLLINVNSNKFEKLLAIMEMLNGINNFEIKLVKNGSVISYGDGPKREFMEAAINQFADEYLIKNNNIMEYNFEKMKRFTNDDLVYIGHMLHAVICNSMNSLSIRLPISLLVAIKNKNIKLNELEYFARLEDPELFETVNKFSSNPDFFAELDSEYTTYEKFIKHMCRCFYLDKDKNDAMKNISDKIAEGFKTYNEVKNINSMNFPTLDCYLSGDYFIDRETLIKNLQVTSSENFTDVEVNNYKNNIIQVIRSLPEEQLLILLKNWSGTSIVKKSTTYMLSISKQKYNKIDIHFGTCGVQITIAQELLDNKEMQPLLVQLLTTPMVTMVDP